MGQKEIRPLNLKVHFLLLPLFLLLFGCGSGSGGSSSASSNTLLLLEGAAPPVVSTTNLQLAKQQSCSLASCPTPPPGATTAFLTTAAIEVGGAKFLTGAVYDVNGIFVSGTTLVWTSSNPSVVSVDPSSGLIQGLAPGRATINANWLGVAGNPVVVTALPLGGGGGPIQNQISVTVLDSTTDDPIQGALVSVSGTTALTDQNGQAVVVNAAMANQPQDLHVYASGYSTVSVYQVNTANMVFTLDPFVGTTGSLQGTVAGMTSQYAFVGTSGYQTPVETLTTYSFPDTKAIDINGNQNPSPSLPVSPRFFAASLVGFSCAPQPLLIHLGEAAGLGPINSVFPILQDFALDSTPVYSSTAAVKTLGAIVLPDFSKVPAPFTQADVQAAQGYANFNTKGVVQTGLDVGTYCALFGQAAVDRTHYSVTSVQIPGASSYWVQLSTDPRSKTTQELGKGFSYVSSTPGNAFPASQDLTLMNIPTQVNPPDYLTNSSFVGTTPTLTWNNTTGQNIDYYEVLLIDAGPAGATRGAYFWKVILPGSPAVDPVTGGAPVINFPIPSPPAGININSGYIIPGNLVKWQVFAYQIPGYDYNTQSGGTLSRYSVTPSRVFRP